MRGLLLLILAAMTAATVQVAKRRFCTCPPGGYTPWTAISRTECSKSCGSGTQSVIYSRQCTNPTHDDEFCSEEDTFSDVVNCNDNPCPDSF